MKKATNERENRDKAEKTLLRQEPAQHYVHAKPDTKAQRMLSLGAASPASPRAVRQPRPTNKAGIGSAPTPLEVSIMTGGNLSRRMPASAPRSTSLPPEKPTERPSYNPQKAQKANKAHQAAPKASRVSEPSRSERPGVRQRLGELRGLLAEGWEIVQPIFARPLWTSPDDKATAFNFVLSRAQATRLVTVPDAASVERFIHARQLVVDMR